MQSVAVWACACVCVLLQCVRHGHADCDSSVTTAIKAHSDPDQLKALHHINGDFEIRHLYAGVRTNDVVDNCIKIGFHDDEGKKSLEFYGMAGSSYALKVEDGVLVYAGKDKTKDKDGKGKEDKDGRDKTNKVKKDKDGKGKEDKDGRGKTDKVKKDNDGKGKEDKDGRDKTNKVKKDNDGKGKEDKDGRDKPDKVKEDKDGEDKTDKVREDEDGEDSNSLEVIKYHAVYYTADVVALYACSEGAPESAMAFIAVSSKAAEKAAADELKAKELMQTVGIHDLKEILFCKDVKHNKPGKKGKRNKNQKAQRRKGKKNKLKNQVSGSSYEDVYPQRERPEYVKGRGGRKHRQHTKNQRKATKRNMKHQVSKGNKRKNQKGAKKYGEAQVIEYE